MTSAARDSDQLTQEVLNRGQGALGVATDSQIEGVARRPQSTEVLMLERHTRREMRAMQLRQLQVSVNRIDAQYLRHGEVGRVNELPALAVLRNQSRALKSLKALSRERP